MKEGQSYPIGTIITVSRYGKSNTFEIIEFVGKYQNADSLEEYKVFELRADRMGAKGKPQKYVLKKGLNEGRNDYDQRQVFIILPKENAPLISQKEYDMYITKQGQSPQEVVWDGDFKPAYLMTKEEYKKVVTPIIKDFQKFLNSNHKFLNKVGYYGLIHETYPKFIERNKSNNWMKLSPERLEESSKKEWISGGRGKKTSRTTDPIPKEVLKEYNSFIEKLTPYLSKEGIEKFDSDEVNSPKRSIRRAIDSDVYKQLLLDGVINYGNLKYVLDDAKLQVPKKLEDLTTKVIAKGVSSGTLMKKEGIEKDFFNEVHAVLRPRMDDVYDEYYTTYFGALSEYSDFQKKETPTRRWREEFCKFIKNPCEEKQVINSRGYATKKLICCSESILIEKSEMLSSSNTPVLPDDWKSVLAKKAESYVNYLIRDLSMHILYYLNDADIPVLPKIKEIENTTVTYNKIEGFVELQYPNGFIFKLTYNMIFAGGYNIQKLHTRYLTHASVNDKGVIQDVLKKMYADFVPTKKEDEVEEKKVEANTEKHKNDMRRSKDNRDYKLEKKMKDVDTSQHGVYNIFEDLVSQYKENKTAENRDLLEAKISEYAGYIKYGLTDLLPILFEANKALPASKRFPMYWLFVKDSDGEAFLVPNQMLKTPVWDYIPHNLIQTMNTKPINFEMRPRNAGLFKMLSEIASTDDLRPAMSGIEMTDEGATATDAHVMVHIAGKKDGKFPDGIYPTDRYMKRAMDGYRETIENLKNNVDLAKTKEQKDYDQKNLKNMEKSFDEYKQNPIIDEKYPNWKGILPKSDKDMDRTRVHLPFLMSVLKTLRDNQLLNQTTHAVELIFPQRKGVVKRMGFNTTLLERLVNVFMMLGVEEADLYHSEASRAMIMLRAGDVWDFNNPIESLTFGLIMPVMLGGYTIETSSVKIVEDNEVEARVGDTQSKTLRYSDFYTVKKAEPKKEPKKQPVDSDEYSEKDFLNEKIEAFKMMYEIEENADEKKFLKQKIEAFELLQEI